MLRHRWDETLCAALRDYDLIGAPYEPIGGFSSGADLVQTYKAFPNAVWVALHGGRDWSAMDWSPAKERPLAIDTAALAALYHLPEGNTLVRDVGWRLPSFCAQRGYRAVGTCPHQDQRPVSARPTHRRRLQ